MRPFSIQPQRRIWLTLFAMLFLLQGCSTMNTVSDGADSRLMLRGHDPVSYFSASKPVIGTAEFKADHQGVTYRFASAASRKLFLKAPDKYAPQYGGFCANGAIYAMKWVGEAENYEIYNDRLFIFGGQKSHDYWTMDKAKNVEYADGYWENEMKDSGARLQSWKRLVFRVPHYKTSKELEAEWQVRKES
ncbi:MAG: YHS domain-containing (seleno)protein [Burkholderiales bacterium]